MIAGETMRDANEINLPRRSVACRVVCACQSVGPSVRPSVSQSVRILHTRTPQQTQSQVEIEIHHQSSSSRLETQSIRYVPSFFFFFITTTTTSGSPYPTNSGTETKFRHSSVSDGAPCHRAVPVSSRLFGHHRIQHPTSSRTSIPSCPPSSAAPNPPMVSTEIRTRSQSIRHAAMTSPLSQEDQMVSQHLLPLHPVDFLQRRSSSR